MNEKRRSRPSLVLALLLLGAANQDVDFADEAWAFFRRHVHAAPARN